MRLRHFPLDKHRHAFAAAQAAEEAFAQGQGWPYVEAVLGRVEELDRAGEAFLVEAAQERGLDAEESGTAQTDGRHSRSGSTPTRPSANGHRPCTACTSRCAVIRGERLDGDKSQEGLRPQRVEADLLACSPGLRPIRRPPTQPVRRAAGFSSVSRRRLGGRCPSR
ncbi:hypothetical protein SFUMM280S_03043 [Streptomyces fumanus]